MSEANISYAGELYLQAKALWRGERFAKGRRHRTQTGSPSVPYGKGRDPQPLGDVLQRMATDMGWSKQLEQTLAITEWPDIVGEDIAQHTEVLSVQGSVLQVQCDSTAWATELRRLRMDIVTKLLGRFPDAGITDITFHGPHAPTWRHGYRRVQGRGPRDTYG